MFPAAGENLALNVGGPNNALNLLHPVHLKNSVTRVYNGSNTLLGLGGAPGDPGAWDGFWPSAFNGGGFAGGGNLNIRRFELELNVSAMYNATRL